MAFEGILLEEACDGWDTMIATLSVHIAPLLPLAVTFTVCAPASAITCVFREVPVVSTVPEPVSSEYPNAVMLCDRQVAPDAASANGDDTEAPLAGLVIANGVSADVVDVG